MAKGLAEATDMVGGALFDQCKSDKMWAADVGRTPGPLYHIDLPTSSLQPPLYSPFSRFGISLT